MKELFKGKTAIFSCKVPSEIFPEWRTSPRLQGMRSSQSDNNGGRLFYEIPRAENATPNYYFTTHSHKNFYNP